MKKTSKQIRKELVTANLKRENYLAIDILKARKTAYVNGETDELNKLLGLPTAYMTAYNDSIASIENVPYELKNFERIVKDAKERVLSDSEKVNLTEMIKGENQDSLKTHKVDTLKALCKTFDLPTTGKKEELINRILDYAYNYTINDTFKTIHDVFDYLVKSGYAVNLTKMIVKKISKGNTSCADTCMNIVFNYYNDSLFDDIYQSIMLELWDMFKSGLVIFADKKLVFKEIIKDEEGHFAEYGQFLFNHESGKANTFLNLFSACRECIESYKMDNDSPKKEDIETVYGLETADLLSVLNDNDSVLNFMDYLKKEDSKNYSIYCGIIQALFEGTKQEELAKDFSINTRKVKYLTAKLYEYAKVFFQCSGKQSIHTVQYIKLNAGGTVVLKKEGATYKESLTGKVINISDTEKYHTTPKKGVRIYEVQYRIG